MQYVPSYASLDPHETTVPDTYGPLALDPSQRIRTVPPRELEPNGLETVFRHSGWRPQRRRVWLALRDSDVGNARIDRFASCGSNAFIARAVDDPTRVTVIANYCHDRFCTPCARERSRRITAAIIAREHVENLKFMTLTLKVRCVGLGETVDRLWVALRKLRRTKLWATKVRGGIAFLETVYRIETNDWHTHLHCLVDADYIPQGLLSAAWEKCTQGSKVVDIRWPRNQANVMRYVTKYASKPLNSSFETHDEPLREAVRDLAHRKLYVQFGTWADKPLQQEDQKHGWTIVCSLTELVRKSKAGDAAAISILSALHRNNVETLYAALPPDTTSRPRPPPVPLNSQALLFPVAETFYS